MNRVEAPHQTLRRMMVDKIHELVKLVKTDYTPIEINAELGVVRTENRRRPTTLGRQIFATVMDLATGTQKNKLEYFKELFPQREQQNDLESTIRQYINDQH